MKKALLLLLFLIQTNLLLAQTMPGIRLGGSISKINGISTSFGSYDWIRHYHGGIILAHKVNDKLYLQPELNYAQKGYQYEIARSNKQVYKDTVLYQETNRINYLDLPILAKIGAKGFYFELGPQFSFLADGERTVTRTTDAGGAINKHSHTMNLIGVVERFDIGFVGGFGYQTLSGLGLGVRFNQSFKEVIDQENWKRSVVVQLSAFYLFGKQKELKSRQQPPAVPNPDIDYYKKRRASKKGYAITTRMNMGRVTFTKLENSNRNHVEYKIISTGNFAPQDIMLAGSSGAVESAGPYTGHRDIVFPFQGSIQFSIPASVSTPVQSQSRMEYEITEPGHWRITITISQ